MQEPAALDIGVERETDAFIGGSINTVREFEDEVEEEKEVQSEQAGMRR